MRIALSSIRAGTLALGLCTLTACNGSSSSGGGGGAPVSQVPDGSPQQTQGFAVTTLVTGTNAPAGGSARTDPDLAKPWDIAASDGPIRVVDAHTDVTAAYDANGVAQGNAVRIPGSRGGSHVTGIVDSSGNTAFAGNAAFIFSTSSGTLATWSGGSQPPVTVYTDPSGTADYTGLALLASGSSSFLYATDFQNGRVDTFDSGFNKISTSGNFRDPNLPAGYMPFNIQTVADRLAVAYVLPRMVNGVSTMGGAGEGIVDLYDASGNLVRRLVTGGPLNAPRGIALAPDNFGGIGGKVLVANSGDGHINAFDRNTGAFAGVLNDARGAPVTIPGISALAFRNGDQIGAASGLGAGSVGSIPDNTLFFTAGTSNSVQSAFGHLQPAPRSGGSNSGSVLQP